MAIADAQAEGIDVTEATDTEVTDDMEEPAMAHDVIFDH